MKKDLFYKITDSHEILFTKSENHHSLPAKAKVEVIISPVLKSGGVEVANAIANAASSSLGNVNVAVQVCFEDETRELLLMNETPLIRNNLDYHEAVRHARNLQEALKKDLVC